VNHKIQVYHCRLFWNSGQPSQYSVFAWVCNALGRLLEVGLISMDPKFSITCALVLLTFFCIWLYREDYPCSFWCDAWKKLSSLLWRGCRERPIWRLSKVWFLNHLVSHGLFISSLLYMTVNWHWYWNIELVTYCDWFCFFGKQEGFCTLFTSSEHCLPWKIL
jgi:hypothetical protein